MNWYPDRASGGQGLVVEEESGRTVALVYDIAETPLLAAAPKLLEALEVMLKDYCTEGCPDPGCDVCARSKEAERKARAAIEEARAEQETI